MSRVVFVTGSAGGVGLETLQHQGTLRKSNGGSCNVLDRSSRKAVEMIAATIWRNFVCFLLKTRDHRACNIRLPALPERENRNIQGYLQLP